MRVCIYPAVIRSVALLAMASMLANHIQIILAADPTSSTFKSERFDHDPDWEGYNNHNVPKEARTVEQDFGYSQTQFASKTPGEIGGSIQRASTPASYAAPLTPARTLDDKLTASGTFSASAGKGGGVVFGFFNSHQEAGSGRPVSSLGLELGFKGGGGRLAVRLITSGNQSCGTFITPFIPGKFRPTPIKTDGTRYRWTLDYDPQAAGGNGRFTFTLHSDTHKTEDYGPLLENFQKEALARFPNTTTFTVDLPPEMRKEGATFDRFGLCNMTKAGGALPMYFGDLEFDGHALDLSKDPGWIGVGNRTNYEDYELVGAHDYGYSAKTSFAGGAPGEVGGILWRSLPFSFYADRVGPLNLEQRLEASGKVKLVTAGPDSDIFLGWFNSAAKDKSAGVEENFVGIHVGGPTRVGHYFIPVLLTATGEKSVVKRGPVLKPGKAFDWSLVYDPAANAGNGEMRLTLGAETVMLALKPDQKNQGASLDRFGLFTSTTGGQMVKIYLDDLKYTVR
jgi:hypothetical protein